MSCGKTRAGVLPSGELSDDDCWAAASGGGGTKGGPSSVRASPSQFSDVSFTAGAIVGFVDECDAVPTAEHAATETDTLNVSNGVRIEQSDIVPKPEFQTSTVIAGNDPGSKRRAHGYLRCGSAWWR